MKTMDQFQEEIELFFEASQIPVCCFERDNLIFRFTHPLQDYNLPLLLFASMPGERPDVWYSFTPEFVYFGGIRIPESPYLLFLGPVLLSECSARQADTICRRIGRKKTDFGMIQRYFSATGPHRVPSLLANLKLLGRFLDLNVSGEIPLLPFSWNLPYPAPYRTPQTGPDDAGNETLENRLMSCVRTGNVAALNQYLNIMIHDPSLDHDLNLTTMRSFILGANLLASRTARSAGVDYALANRITGKYIDQILQARTATDLTLIFFRFFQEYTVLVAKLLDLPSGSPVVHSVHQYIAAHYSEKITPHILADALHLNVSYLCTHFKKETGMTISAYVQEEKVREAKRLLEGSNDSITEISVSLGFSSQSYFCAVFKKITGMTPQSYRLSI